MGMDWTQVPLQAVNGWTASAPYGTTCIISRTGTTQSGAVAKVFLTDLLVGARDTQPVDVTVYNGTRYLIRLEMAGTNSLLTYSFKTYPHTDIGTALDIVANSPNGTCSLSACGFDY